MSKITDTITNPQFRQWLYTVLLFAVPLLIAYGIIDAVTAALWIALGGAVLGLGTATGAVAKQRASGVLPSKTTGDDSV
jgi:hypothetical protein